MEFIDPFNPNENELRHWAADPNRICPSQDWDLIVADWERIDLIVELASTDLPGQDWFLALLYLLTGECFRTERGRTDIPQLQTLLAHLEGTTSKPLALFCKRATALLEDPSLFDYSLWCGGGYPYYQG